MSIALTIFITDRPEKLADWTHPWFVTATVLWMLSVLLAFFVLFPQRHRFHADAPADIKRAYQRITRTKMRLFIASLASFFAALGLAAYAYLAGS